MPSKPRISKFSNLKTTLFICCCCQPLPCNPWWFLNPMNPIHLPKILKSSLKKVHKSNPSSYYSFIPFNHYDPYLWLSFLSIQPFAPTHFSLQKNPNSLKEKNPSLKNISWPVPLTSFGPRFKRKKKTNPSNYSSEEHYSNKTNTYHHYPKLPYFFYCC